MSLSDKIFPPPPAPDGNVLRLGLVGSWESQFLGLGRLTGFLTPRLMKQSHAVDDMGLYVAFLQRHRVEVGLKLILERAAAPIPNTHVIKDLFDACEAACKKVGFLTDWQTFAGAQGEFVDLMDEVDPGLPPSAIRSTGTPTPGRADRSLTWSRSKQQARTSSLRFLDSSNSLRALNQFRSRPTAPRRRSQS